MPNLNEFGDIDRMIIQNDIITILHGIANSFNGIVLTRPSKLKLVENKAFQLLFAIKNNINIPKSFMGNSNYELQKLVDNTSIIKPISRGKYTNKNETVLFQTEIFSHWSEDINSTPIYVQKYIEKQYEVRITVVGQCIFAVRIDTLNKIDWRKDYENHKYTIIDIPNEIKEFIYMCMNDFEIEFGAFDFIVNNADEWVFLEVNPNGQWLWLEQELNISISDEIFRLLLR